MLLKEHPCPCGVQCHSTHQNIPLWLLAARRPTGTTDGEGCCKVTHANLHLLTGANLQLKKDHTSWTLSPIYYKLYTVYFTLKLNVLQNMLQCFRNLHLPFQAAIGFHHGHWALSGLLVMWYDMELYLLILTKAGLKLLANNVSESSSETLIVLVYIVLIWCIFPKLGCLIQISTNLTDTNIWIF